MNIQAVRILGRPADASPVRSYLEVTNPQDLEEIKRGELPVAYVVRSKDLTILRQFKPQIVDRGTKREKVDLSRLLLAVEGIPLVEGIYRDSGQLRRSVRTLLRNALGRGERNVYFVGVDEGVFATLWEQSGQPQPGGHAAASRGPGDQASWVQSILDSLPVYEEPEDLKALYIGDSPEVKLVRRLILIAANTDCKVLIAGETGTGKELVARSIHKYCQRGRAGQVFLAVNCAAIPSELLESELFGGLKGAYTGATDRKGLWEMADRGTLFLDEIGDLSLYHQAKILRALDEKEIRPVGWKQKRGIPIDVRIIAATNRDLFSMVRTGQFREDLFFRLREFLIQTPPLRSHPGDFPIIAQGIWRRITGDSKNTLSRAILDALQALPWSGNVRELRSELTLLRTLYGTAEPRAEHLRVVSWIQRQGFSPRGEPLLSEGIGVKQLECLNRLRKVEEVIRAMEFAVRPLAAGRKVDSRTVAEVQEAVQNRLSELDMLCGQPLLFHDAEIFSGVHQLKGKLSYFKDLAGTDPPGAVQFLKKEIAKGFGQTLTALAREIRSLLEGSS